MLFVPCVLFAGATCSCCCNNLSCRNACVDLALPLVYLCALHSAFAFALVFLLLLLFLFLLLFSFVSFCFVLLSACVVAVVFVLFNVIASTLVHRHGHGHEARGLRHMATPATPFLPLYYMWYVCVFYTMHKLFFNISAADAICLGRKLDKRLASSLHGFAPTGA